MEKNEKISFFLLTILGFFGIPIVVYTEVFDQFIAPKFFIFFTAAALSLAVKAYSFSPLYFLKFSKKSFLILVSLICLYFLSVFMNGNLEVNRLCLDWLAFFSIAYTVFCISEDLEEIILKVEKILILSFAICILLFLTSAFFPNSSLSFFEYSTFGNSNIFSEYLGFVFLWILWSRHYCKKNENFKISILFIIFFLIFYMGSRATLLGVTSVLAYFLLKVRKFNSSNKKYIYCLIFLLTTLTILIITFKGIGKAQTVHHLFLYTKMAGVGQRVSMWINSIMMVRDYPLLGIGPGNFEFYYLNYAHSLINDISVSEEARALSPHNCFIELVVENGILFFCLFIYGFYKFLTKIIQSSIREKHFVIMFFIFFIIDGFFAFPMELPFTFFSMAFMLGIAVRVAQYKREKFINLNILKIVKTGLFLISFVIILGSTLFLTSKFSEYSTISSEHNLKFHCKLNLVTSNCLKYVDYLIAKGKFETADSILDDILKVSPFNIHALYGKGRIKNLLQDELSACYWYKAYDSLFNNFSSLHSRVVNYCY